MFRAFLVAVALITQSVYAATPHPTEAKVTYTSSNPNRTILFCAVDSNASVCKIPPQEETLVLTRQDVSAAFGDGRVFFFNDQEAVSGCKWIAEKRYPTRRFDSVEITRKPTIKQARRNQFSCMIKWSAVTPTEYSKMLGFKKTHSIVHISYNNKQQYIMMEVEK